MSTIVMDTSDRFEKRAVTPRRLFACNSPLLLDPPDDLGRAAYATLTDADLAKV